MKLAFVILNYGTYPETVDCVQSIRKHIDVMPQEYHITIVDNGSSDDSVARLRDDYAAESNIDIIETGENVGFAKGNNIGIRHVNQNYFPDYIVILNSDTELIQDDLYKKLSSEYERSGFALLGPMMLTGDGRCNDSPWQPMSREAAEKRLDGLKRREKQIMNGTFFLCSFIQKVKKSFLLNSDRDTIHIHGDFWKYQTQVELQGAFLVFSQKAFKYIEGFDERTFLYYEEQLLYLALIRAKQTIVYDPRICIYHKDGCATSKAAGKKKQKRLFQIRCNIESIQVLIGEMDKQKEGDK